jgi:hypothetical protein
MPAGRSEAEMKDSLQIAIENANTEELGALAEYLMSYIEWIVGDSIDGFDSNNMVDALEAYPSENAELEPLQ